MGVFSNTEKARLEAGDVEAMMEQGKSVQNEGHLGLEAQCVY